MSIEYVQKRGCATLYGLRACIRACARALSFSLSFSHKIPQSTSWRRYEHRVREPVTRSFTNGGDEEKYDGDDDDDEDDDEDEEDDGVRERRHAS